MLLPVITLLVATGIYTGIHAGYRGWTVDTGSSNPEPVQHLNPPQTDHV